jgi:hypothetical protein
VPDVIRLVVDTNVIVSAAITHHRGRLSHNVDLILFLLEGRDDSPDLFISNAILNEYEDVLSRPEFHFRPAYVDAFLGAIEAVGIAIEPERLRQTPTTSSPTISGTIRMSPGSLAPSNVGER